MTFCTVGTRCLTSTLPHHVSGMGWRAGSDISVHVTMVTQSTGLLHSGRTILLILKSTERRRGGWELCVRVRANLNLERSGDNGGSSNLSYSPSIPQSLSLSLALSLSRYCTCFNLSSIGLEMSLWSFRL